MVKFIAIFGFGIMMALISATASWFVQNKVLKPTNLEAAVADADDESAVAGESPEGAPENLPPRDDGTLKTGPVNEQMPVPVRAREMSVEELLRYGMGVKEREKKVQEQEELLQKRRIQQQLAEADIEGERKEIDGLRVQVSEQLKQAEKLIDQLKSVRSQLLQEQESAAERLQQIKHERVEIDAEHMDNTKRLSQWIQSMDPEKAADVLKSMADDGQEQLEIAVQILRNLEEREAAKILSAIDDTKLVQLLIEKFRNLEQPPKEKTARR